MLLSGTLQLYALALGISNKNKVGGPYDSHGCRSYSCLLNTEILHHSATAKSPVNPANNTIHNPMMSPRANIALALGPGPEPPLELLAVPAANPALESVTGVLAML